ncbi:MAG: HEAT repeat domain-containing protein [Acidobacteriota bacterium]|nr:HEAT repeat domain-containing protein [Acidobacteriota bacterium]
MKFSAFSRIGLLVSLAIGAAACSTTGGSGRAQEPQARAAARMAKSPDEQSIAELRASLRNPDLMIRIGAVQELGRRAPSSADAVAAVVEAFSDTAPLVRRFAAGGLAEVRAPAAPTVLALARLLRDPEPEPRESAARTLAALSSRVPQETVAELGSMLSAAAADAVEAVRANAVEALGGLGARGARAVPSMKQALERALGDPSDTVRGAAVEAVGKLGSGVSWTVPLLTKALADPVHDVRKMAVIALEKIGPDAAPAAKALARQLHGKEIYLRVFAADALTAIGPAGSESGRGEGLQGHPRLPGGGGERSARRDPARDPEHRRKPEEIEPRGAYLPRFGGLHRRPFDRAR